MLFGLWRLTGRNRLSLHLGALFHFWYNISHAGCYCQPVLVVLSIEHDIVIV